MIRLYCQTDLRSDAEVALPSDISHYLAHVMRQGVGDEVQLFNGRDGEWVADITAITKKAVALRPRQQTRPQPSLTPLHLYQAVIKRPRLETIAEKATELGVSDLHLVQTDYTQNAKMKLDRLKRITIEAAEQTGRLDLPRVHGVQRLSALALEHDLVVFCDEAGGTDIIEALQTWCSSGRSPGTKAESANLALVIGPEGGFSPTERAQLRALPQTLAVSLGPRILRADTAAIAALSIIQATLGDWPQS